MKKVNDSKVYLIFALPMLVLAVVSASVSLYSIKSVEPVAAAYIEKGAAVAATVIKGMPVPPEIQSEIDKNYTAAYALLKKGQLFALYQYFDGNAAGVKKTLEAMDLKVSKKEAIPPFFDSYLKLLLDRRKAGSDLGMKSSYFFFIFSVLGFLLFGIEKYKARKN